MGHELSEAGANLHLCARLQAGKATEKWLGVKCCGFHMAWTKAACPERAHSFYVDNTLLTLGALKTGAGLAYLPCFMGDSEPALARLFCEHMQREIAGQRALFEGRST